MPHMIRNAKLQKTPKNNNRTQRSRSVSYALSATNMLPTLGRSKLHAAASFESCKPAARTESPPSQLWASPARRQQRQLPESAAVNKLLHLPEFLQQLKKKMLSAELSKGKYLKLAEVCKAPSTALHATPKKQTNKKKNEYSSYDI